ncbi:2Fe-2S iron-sulfur cluster-binding protein [Paenibacillus sp. 1001270B_150601_E10]|uniref:2Fe-2S iron-sulfur cluster-binding protein n=1 Tax=Paenibacillus sp. 1001270B_150601_E10 TaxID=2787079 RepID=UPI0018A0C451|nr:2Fe-2S iron-sulfur cluster-binding protein [Paenibacillus sp. 1001270B_150601_E10]
MGELRLKGRTIEETMPTPVGSSLLQAALHLKVDWNYNCSRGTCARCRCQVIEGEQYLNDITDAEWNRMDEEEFEEGYRLSCQAVIEQEGNIVAIHKPYF